MHTYLCCSWFNFILWCEVVSPCYRHWHNNLNEPLDPFPFFWWLLNKKAARVEVNILLAFLYWVGIAICPWPFISDIVIFVLERDVKHRLTNAKFSVHVTSGNYASRAYTQWLTGGEGVTGEEGSSNRPREVLRLCLFEYALTFIVHSTDSITWVIIMWVGISQRVGENVAGREFPSAYRVVISYVSVCCALLNPCWVRFCNQQYLLHPDPSFFINNHPPSVVKEVKFFGLYFDSKLTFLLHIAYLSLIHIWRCRRSYACRSRWSPYH